MGVDGMSNQTPPASYADAVELNWWWILAGVAPSFVTAAAITAAVNNAHHHDWWVLSAVLAIVIVAVASSRHYPALTIITTTAKNSRTLIRPREGKTARAACAAIGATTGVLLAGVFSLVAVMMDASTYDGYDDGCTDGWRHGHNCAGLLAPPTHELAPPAQRRLGDAYRQCRADFDAGDRPVIAPPKNSLR